MNTQKYFFDTGLRFECTQCGGCCTGAPGIIRVSEEEIRALAALRSRSRDDFAREFLRPIEGGGQSLREKPDGSCVFFDRQCTVYPARPAQCRTYPFWIKNLRTPEAWQRAACECPGIGTGRIWTRNEILDIVRDSPA